MQKKAYSHIGYILFIAIFSLGFNLSGQELKHNSVKYALGIIENYTVLKSNKNIKHGEYFQIFKNDTIVYGQYENNIKSGIWKYYSFENELTFIYDFSTSKVIDWKCQPINQRCRNIGSASSYSLGNFAAYAKIGSKIDYPEESASNGFSGSPVVYMVINEKGELVKYFIGETSGYADIDRAALKAANNSCNEEWIPAYDGNGNAISDTLYFKLNFVL